MEHFFCPLCGSGEQFDDGDHFTISGTCSKCEISWRCHNITEPAPFEPDPDELENLKEQMSGQKP